MKNLIEQIIKNNELKFIKDKNIITKLNENFNINFSTSELIKLKSENNNILYPNNFYIINSHIYKNLLKYIFLNRNYTKEKDKKKNYIINNGQIILEYDYIIENNDNKYFNIILGKINKDNTFISEGIIFFGKNKTERDSEFEKLKETRNIQYNTNNNNAHNIDNPVIFFKNENKENIQNEEKIKKINKCIELLINIYIHFKDINNKIQIPLNGSNPEFYYVIKKEWINYFLEEFEYKKKFLEFIKIDNSDKITNINENQNSLNIKDNKIDYNDINKIKNKLSFDFLEEIKQKINNENIIKNLSNIELYALKSENKKVGNETINYYDNIVIINDNINNLILELFKLNIKKNISFYLEIVKLL